MTTTEQGKTLTLVESYQTLNTEWEAFDLLTELKNMVARGEVRPTIYERIFALTMEKNQNDKLQQAQQQQRRGGGILSAVSSTNSLLSGSRNASTSDGGAAFAMSKGASSTSLGPNADRQSTQLSPQNGNSKASPFSPSSASISSPSSDSGGGGGKSSKKVALMPEPAAVEGIVFIRHPQYTHHGTHNGVWRRRLCRVCTTKVEWAISDASTGRRAGGGFLASFESIRRPTMMNSVQFTEDVKIAEETSYTKVTGRPNDKTATEVLHIVSGARSGFVGEEQLLEGGRVLLSIAVPKADFPKWSGAVRECLRKYLFSLSATDEIVHLDRPVSVVVVVVVMMTSFR